MNQLRILGGSLFLLFFSALTGYAQPERWQQRVVYTMDIDMDVRTHQYKGTQRLLYVNNSPDTLYKVFYHLYFNAFQPGSMMDVRSRTIPDPDPRVGERISKLAPNEQGWIKVRSLRQNGRPLTYEINETILEVALAQPILPNTAVTFDMEWDAQVPIQVRRSGRDSQEGIAYSMAQWYPKLCEYDYQGWHANPYIAREFYGVWGDYEVTIHIDKKYVVAAGGVLQNPQEVGCGYERPGEKMQLPAGDRLTYRFRADNVHDFCWAADPDYTHKSIVAEDGSTMRFFWQKGKGYDAQWEQLPTIMSKARTFVNANFGKYPYPEYSFIQGGDGGMEYPMATLITGNRPLNSLVGVAVHEQMHTWYQMVLGSNESLYGWMDEGFTSYAEDLTMNDLARQGLLFNRAAEEDPLAGTYTTYTVLATSGREEPLTTHADHFHSNYAYSLGSYVKGAVFMSQLEYILGKENLQKGLLRYFHTWKFKHPNANDMVRVFEKQSGLELDWYRENFVNTTNTIDYGVKDVVENTERTTTVTIERVGDMAMPLDVLVTYANGQQELFYAPLESMRGVKPQEGNIPRTVLPDHRWVDKSFTFTANNKDVVRVQIDPANRMADVDKANNLWEKK